MGIKFTSTLLRMQPCLEGKGRRYLVLLAEVLLLALAFGGLGGDFLVVLLEGSEIFTSLGELTFLHALTDVPVNESTLGVHEVELMVDAGEYLSDGRGVGDHAHSALHAGKVAARHDGRRLVVDTALEAGGAPVNELDGALGLDGSDSSVDILRDYITTVHEAARHVLAVARIALSHHGGGLEGRVGDLSNRELFVVGLLRRDDRGVRGKHEVDTGVRDEVGLELSDVDVEGTIEAEGSGQGGDDLSDEAVEVGVGGALDVEGTAADVVDGFVVEHDGDVSMLEERVGGQHGVVRLNDSGGHLRGRVDGEAELGLAAVVDGEALEEEGAEAGAGAAANSVKDEEALEAGAVVGELADAVEDEVDDLLADGVVATGVVVRSVFLAGDDLLRVVELAVGSGADFVAHGGLEVNVDGTGNVLASTSLGKEGVESIVTAADGLVGRHLAVGLNAVLEAVEFPAGVTSLDAALADVDGDYFTHCRVLKGGGRKL